MNDELVREKLRDLMGDVVRAGWTPGQLCVRACEELAAYLRSEAQAAEATASEVEKP